MNRSVFRIPNPPSLLPFDGERYVSGLLGDASTGDIQSEHYHRYLFALAFCAEKDVLDVASGEGYGSACLGQVARSVVGVDANAEAVKFANASYLNDRVSFKCGRAQLLPIESMSIDVVVSFETLEHFAEHDLFIGEVRRVLRPGGLLIISSPNRPIYSEETNYRNEYHVRELDRHELLFLLNQHFPNVALLSQRPLTGSVIAANDHQVDCSVPEGFIWQTNGAFERTEGVPHPPFFVAITSDDELPVIRPSLLHNPALLNHLSNQHRQSTDELDRRREQVRDLETLVSARTEQVSQLETVLAQQSERLEAVGHLETFLTEKTNQSAGLETELRAQAEQISQLQNQLAQQRTNFERIAQLESMVVQKTDQLALLETQLGLDKAELTEVIRRAASIKQRNEAVRVNAQARISVLRGELGSAHRRSEEMVSALEAGQNVSLTLQAQNETLRAELDALRGAISALEQCCSALTRQRDHLSITLGNVVTSRSWKTTAPVRRIAAKLPPVIQNSLRSLVKGSAASNGLGTPESSPQLGRPEVEKSEQIQTLVPFSTTRIASETQISIAGPKNEEFTPVDNFTLPSQRFRLAHPDWVQPQQRAEFAALRTLKPSARIAVVLHLYYVDLWDEILESILNIIEPFDLFVTLVFGASEQIAPQILAVFPEAKILTLDNHGRDILPFMELLRSGVLFRYELICKLHSKRTTWRPGGDEWRQHLIRGILGQPETVEKILSAFDSDPDLGIVAADQQVFTGREYWASNESRLLQIAGKIGLNASVFEKGFIGGSIFWIRTWLLRSIDALGLGFDDFECEPIGSDGTTAHAVERLFSFVCHDAGMRMEESGNLQFGVRPQIDGQPTVHLIANYLPQFHPIPENNLWWGEGFTEWTNVTGTAPIFKDHRQPRLPADLGFYDLRLSEARQMQADLARHYGISAFSYYYYWFNGRRLLERPLEEVVASGVPDFPFMICWANEPWTRNWDGLSKEVLLAQDYSPEWERRFARDIAPMMRDRRYLQLNGRPVLAIYRVMHIPDPAEAMSRLRACLLDEGLPPVHLIGGWLRIGEDENLPPVPEDLNLDAYFEFPPHHVPAQKMEIDPSRQVPGFAAHIYDYNATVDAAVDQLVLGSEGFRYRSVMAGWDNTARRHLNAFAFHGATPTNFRRWLRAVVEQSRVEAVHSETAVFINAWNEWAEGTYLEPDRDFGHGWLEAVASAASCVRTPRAVEPKRALAVAAQVR